MKNNTKVILSGIIVATVVSLLFLVVPITDAFITSYIFTLIGIICTCATLCVFKKDKVPQSFSYISSAISYITASIIFSIIACIFNLSLKWTLVIHVVILAIFTIRIIALSSANKHITQLDETASKKSAEFQKEKQNYWK